MCGIVEHSGHGVPIVVREYGSQAYTFSKDMITVTIPFNKKKNASIKLSNTQTNILLEIEKNNHITIIELSKILDLNETTISRNLKVLVEKDIIARIGSRKTGHWEIKE